MAKREVVHCHKCEHYEDFRDEYGDGSFGCGDYRFKFFDNESKDNFCCHGVGDGRAEDVILCKDCRHFRKDDNWCKFAGDVGGVSEDSYCSNAEPKLKLQILVPQYTEGDEVIKPLLDSIALQQSVDFNEVGVIICNDGSDVYLSRELLDSYPFKIEYYKEPHKGVSATRNACLDKATADYVMFCDIDDMFMNICGLYILFREFDQGFDSLISVFMEETRHPQTKEVIYTNHEMDSTFVHGKVHRRQYLIDNHIRWNENLTIHEDSYFNILCQNLSTNVKYCQVPFYLWKWRDNSVCRHDPKYILKTYRNMLDSNDALIDEFLSRGRQDKAMFYTTFMVFDAYYCMNKPEWINQGNQEYRDKTERHFARWFAKHEDLWDTMPITDKMVISNQIRGRSITEGMQMEAVTVEGWLKHIKALGEEN